MKKIIVFIFVAFTLSTLAAQDFKQFFITTGGAYGTHQNQTFSKSALTGGGINMAIGGGKHAKNLFRWKLAFPIQFYTLNNVIETQSPIVDASLSFTWMKGIKKDGANRLYVGGEIEGGLLFRQSEFLGNNGTSVLYTNTLSVASRLERPLGKKWRLGLEASIGLLSWAKVTDGYAYAASQEFLENGEFNYLDDPTGQLYKYGEIAPIGKFNRIKTDISLFQDGDKARWGTKYSWNLKAYEPFTNGQIVQGTHGLQFFIGFKIGRKKAARKERKAAKKANRKK
ncbi:MAG: hypothetical protein AB8G86_29310 [Saprospiraceae bacterium]